jgi:hypothetical protein
VDKGGDVELIVELGDLAKYNCSCCGMESETVHGFLYGPDGTTTVYFAGYTCGHAERRANLVLSVGGWGEGTTPEDRTAIALQVRSVDGAIEFEFPPAATSPWHGKGFLGIMLSPEELSDQDRARYRRIASVAVEKDPRVSGYLGAG